MYESKHWSVTEWDCWRRNSNEYAWDNENGKLCTNNEKTANLFKILLAYGSFGAINGANIPKIAIIKIKPLVSIAILLCKKRSNIKKPPCVDEGQL